MSLCELLWIRVNYIVAACLVIAWYDLEDRSGVSVTVQ